MPANGLPDNRPSHRENAQHTGIHNLLWRCELLYKRSLLWFFFFFTIVLTVLTTQQTASSAQLTLTWLDNSTDETGFTIERRVGTNASYQQLASVGSNITSYTDLNLL